MKIENISTLYDSDYNINHLFAMRQQWQTNGWFNMEKPRETGCLISFCGCTAEYIFKNTRLFVPKGAILYIPSGTTYKSHFLECEENSVSTILINFKLLFPNGEYFDIAEDITVLRQKPNSFLTEKFNDAVDIFSSAVVSVASLKVAIYQILTELSHEKHKQKLYSKKFSSIADGIIHLEKEPCSKKSIEDIADMCHVSPATFRRLFKEYSGISPIEYRITSKIEYAKKLLSMGTMSISEVSNELGFDDYTYFCRIFKKHTGLTPGSFRLKSQP